MAQSGASGSPFTGTVRPALAQVGQALSQINIDKWKAPGQVRSAAAEDVSSIQRDLNGTLAGLMQQSDASPGSVSAAFAVYRNVNALYDTLLRVDETAGLAAPDRDMSALDGALNQLEAARNVLADQILSGTEAQQADIGRMRAALASAPAAPRSAKTTVVDDGPAPAAEHKRHTTHRKSTEKPAPRPANPQ